ncbi:MAG TPA: imidazole glycerol phosphate synthase subunit HisH [Balneolaceae bacterium]|nr:imidazole glycerol phosphate synthase subunit HisH [Balneolaceae bacterium]
MIGIIKYQAGNLASVANALDRLNADYMITDDKQRLEEMDAVIFPGVGHAAAAMDDLRSRDLDMWLINTSKPVLGICLGMQLLFDSSEEGNSDTLGIIPGTLKKFDSKAGKVPHMGWNSFCKTRDHPLLSGLNSEHYMYYVHSYFAPVTNDTLATACYSNEFASVVGKDNYLGVQFHPEKSGVAGSLLLQNFLTIIKSATSI